MTRELRSTDSSKPSAGKPTSKATQQPLEKPAAPANVKPGMYIVEKIVSERSRKGHKEYFIKWEGYESAENTWEPERKLKNNEALVEWRAAKKK